MPKTLHPEHAPSFFVFGENDLIPEAAVEKYARKLESQDADARVVVNTGLDELSAKTPELAVD